MHFQTEYINTSNCVFRVSHYLAANSEKRFQKFLPLMQGVPEISSPSARVSRHPRMRTLMTQFNFKQFLITWRNVISLKQHVWIARCSKVTILLVCCSYGTPCRVGFGKKKKNRKKDRKCKLLHLASQLLNRSKPQYAGLHFPFVFTDTNVFHGIYILIYRVAQKSFDTRFLTCLYFQVTFAPLCIMFYGPEDRVL
jgi:hypothetical protein